MKEQIKTPGKELGQEISGQDGGIGRYSFLPRTTKRTTNLKNNQNYKKIELCKSDHQEVKKETFIQTGRRGGDEQLGKKVCGKAAAEGPGKRDSGW